MDCHFWIFLTQGSNPGLPQCRQTPYHLSHKGSPPKGGSDGKETKAAVSELSQTFWERLEPGVFLASLFWMTDRMALFTEMELQQKEWVQEERQLTGDMLSSN